MYIFSWRKNCISDALPEIVMADDLSPEYDPDGMLAGGEWSVGWPRILNPSAHCASYWLRDWQPALQNCSQDGTWLS